MTFVNNGKRRIVTTVDQSPQFPYVHGRYCTLYDNPSFVIVNPLWHAPCAVPDAARGRHGTDRSFHIIPPLHRRQQATDTLWFSDCSVLALWLNNFDVVENCATQCTPTVVFVFNFAVVVFAIAAQTRADMRRPVPAQTKKFSSRLSVGTRHVHKRYMWMRS